MQRVSRGVLRELFSITPQTPQQLQDFIKTYDNGLLAAAATINFMRAWMEEREIV